jgi:cytochrome c2
MLKYLLLPLLLFPIFIFANISDEEIFNSKCSACHSIKLTTKKIKTKSEWKNTVNRMKSHGMKIKSNERAAILRYLNKNYTK